MKKSSRILASLALLLTASAAPLAAQKTHRITGDKLEATIRAATAGDIILVSGTVPITWSFKITKPLYIHGTSNAQFTPFLAYLEISGIGKGQEFALTGFRQVPQLAIDNCDGSVLLANLQVQNTFTRGLGVLNCKSLAIANCVFGPTTISGSRVTISDSTIEGRIRNPRYFLPGAHGLLVLYSTLTAWNTTVLGGYDQHDKTAIELLSSTAWLHSCQLKNRKISGHFPAVGGTGTLTYDPSVQFTVASSAKTIDPRLKASKRNLPLLTMPQTPLGAQTAVTLRGTAGATFAMLFGTPGAPVTVPGIGGALEVASPVILRLGKLPTGGFSQITFRVPDVPALRGKLFRWQGGTITGSVADWSNAVTECHF